jgi:hypothetical protein
MKCQTHPITTRQGETSWASFLICFFSYMEIEVNNTAYTSQGYDDDYISFYRYAWR